MEEKRYVCPYCGTLINKEDVLFWEQVKTMYTDNIRGEFLKRHGVRVSAGNKFSRVYYRVQPEEANVVRVDAQGFPTMIEDHLGNSIVPEDLAKARSGKQSDSFDDAFDSDDFDDDSTRDDGRNYEVHNIPKRACPQCHCELPQQFGTIPTYHVAMFGGRAAGKTAYLVNLFQQLKMQLGQNDLGSVELGTESAGFLQPMIDDYERDGTTRPTPADGGLLPILCHYRNRDNEAFITFYDIAGEGTGDAAYMANHKGIANCESLMLMIDPNMFVGGAFYGAWTANHLEGEDRYNDYGDCCKEPLDSFLNQAGELCKEYSDGIKNVICVITKVDMMLEADAKFFASGDIELLEDVKDKHRGAVNLPVLKRVNTDLRAYFEKKHQVQLRDKLAYTFGNDVKINILGVSTSTRAPGKEIRFEPRSAAIESKHRIIEPFLVVLMYFGLIPAKDQNGNIITYRGNNEEPPAPPVNPEPPKEQRKRGLFHRRNK
ncbi:MAG: hypothetical protein IKE15_09120 [Clostridia bacterium]|nr:hypothetical protein [Clostridia bacterium]